jgi:hypothetical protein
MSAQADVRYDVQARDVKVGDAVGTSTGGIFWNVVEVVDTHGPVYVRASNQLSGRSHRIRKFYSPIPVVIVRSES